MPLKQKIESPRLESYKLNRRLTEIIKVASEYIMARRAKAEQSFASVCKRLPRNKQCDYRTIRKNI
jgi:type II restriction/modification system DNA methylase subunit YeeA